jgi:outer membrane protein assembly factor BamB
MFHHDLTHSGYSTSTAPKTNQTLWTYNTSGYVDSSPAVVNDTVYVGSNDDNVYALNATTGALAWKYKTSGGVDSSPAVAGGVVYIGSEDDNVYALNATTGALVWKYTTGGEVESSPAVVGGVVYVGSDDDNVYALNASTGALAWNYTTYTPVYSAPAVANGLVYASEYHGITYALNASTGTLVWNYTAFATTASPPFQGWINTSPVVAGGIIFVIAWYPAPTGFCNIFALNASTGALMWWNECADLGQSSLAVAGGVIFIGTTTNIPFAYGYVLAFNASTGGLLWYYTNRVSWYTFYSPSVAGGVVFMGGYNKFFALNASTGALVWSYATGGAVESSPAVADGVVYVGSEDGNVYAFGSVHDVAVTSVVPSKTVVGRGYSVKINVTAADPGTYTETFNVTAYANTTIIATLTNITLTSGNSKTITFTWNTTGVPYGSYIIKVQVALAPSETNTASNTFVYGIVKVTIPGDIDGGGYVGARDLGLLGAAYGSYPRSPNWNPNADIDGKGYVGPRDLGLLGANYGKYW